MKLRQDFLFVVTFLAPILSAALTLGAQSARAENVATFPDTLDGRKVLAVDLHVHTVFSDGRVWPNVRVDEALREGLSGFAFTDHEDCPPAVGGCPHRKDFPVPDHNRPYEIGKEYLATKNNQSLVLINGMEITRDNPPGHVNAVFVTDANALMKTDPVEAYMAAKAQGAFLTWNHPTFARFAPDGLFHVTPMIEKLISDGLIQGIEVANGMIGLPEDALQYALDHHLTVIGTSDMHQPAGMGLDADIRGFFDASRDGTDHRTVTLVLAKEASAEAIKAALFAGQTVAWHHDVLAGREDNVAAVVKACLTLKPLSFNESSILAVNVRNACPQRFMLQNQTMLNDKAPAHFVNVADEIFVDAHGSTLVRAPMGDERETVRLKFEVANTLIRPRTHATVELSAPIPPAMRPGQAKAANN